MHALRSETTQRNTARLENQIWPTACQQNETGAELGWRGCGIEPFMGARIIDCQSVSQPSQHMLLCRCHTAMGICQAYHSNRMGYDMGVNVVTAHMHLSQHIAIWLLQFCKHLQNRWFVTLLFIFYRKIKDLCIVWYTSGERMTVDKTHILH